MDRWRIIHRMQSFEGEDGLYDASEVHYITLWSGENFPSEEEEIRAHVISVGLSHEEPDIITYLPHAVHEGVVLQGGKLEKLGSGVLEMVWNDYEKLPQDIAY
jgi:hypothetical protein